MVESILIAKPSYNFFYLLTTRKHVPKIDSFQLKHSLIPNKNGGDLKNAPCLYLSYGAIFIEIRILLVLAYELLLIEEQSHATRK